MAALSVTDADKKDPYGFWNKVRNDQSYSQPQRDFATDQWRAESQWTGTDPTSMDRRGYTFRNIDQFNTLGAPQTSTNPNDAPAPGYQQQAPGAPQTTQGALANDAAPGANTTTQGTQQLLNDTLIGILGQGTNVSVSDPVLRPQAEAYRFARERARAQEQQAMAERFGNLGGGALTGALDSAVQGGYQDAGRDVAGFEAELVGNELSARRDQIMKALALGGELISADQRLALQKQIADLDAAIRREGLAVQSSLGQGDIDLRNRLGTGDLSLRALIALMNNQQFNDDLGFRIGSTEASLNNQALIELMRR